MERISAIKGEPQVKIESIDTVYLDSVLERNMRDPENLIMILQDISAKYNYLPGEVLEYVVERLNVPMSLIYSAATFYKAFSLKPRGKYIVNVCLGTACHVRGADKIKECLEERLNIHEGETTEDLKFTLETVRCLGCCALGPVITVNETSYGGLDREKASRIIDQYEDEA
jgi:NADH:ubiquinone oxidoreductase subunit E